MKKATENDITVRKLPLELIKGIRRVLNIDVVIKIMSKYLELGDWRDAIKASLSKKQYHAGVAREGDGPWN